MKGMEWNESQINKITYDFLDMFERINSLNLIISDFSMKNFVYNKKYNKFQLR